MITLRRSNERGHANHGWLDSYHTFSFADYHDPDHMGYGPLRVINEDRIAPGGGFGMHPHHDMEIVTYIVSGSLEHRDSLGNSGVIRRGDIQRMTAGTGITHSEYNPSDSEPAHLLQIWIRPDHRGHAPSYDQKRLSAISPDASSLLLLASPDGRDDSVRINQNADIYAAFVVPKGALRLPNVAGRRGWIQVIKGNVKAAHRELAPGDALSFEQLSSLDLSADESAEALVFLLAE